MAHMICARHTGQWVPVMNAQADRTVWPCVSPYITYNRCAPLLLTKDVLHTGQLQLSKLSTRGKVRARPFEAAHRAMTMKMERCKRNDIDNSVVGRPNRHSLRRNGHDMKKTRRNTKKRSSRRPLAASLL